jgi:hypothetical protein
MPSGNEGQPGAPSVRAGLHMRAVPVQRCMALRGSTEGRTVVVTAHATADLCAPA